MLGHLGLDGFKVEQDPAQSDVIVVNTCSFIEASKRESIETILELADYKNADSGKCQALVVSGCLAQRYVEELEKELPEVDLIIGTGEYHKIANLLSDMEKGSLAKKSHVEIPEFIHSENDPRINTSPFYMAWLKVSEGCNRNCTFCIIPTIRGKLRSRSVESLVKEAQDLVKTGVVELNVISQDLSDYGHDLDDKNKLFDLIKALDEVEGIKWVRLFYYYPDELSDEIIQFLSTAKRIVPYLDMPVQHFSDSVLKRMNRKITGTKITERINKLRSTIPHMVVRTSIIVGFPGETDEDFERLLKGVEEAKFDHLGIFRYSDEEGTPAFKLTPKVPQEVIEARFDRLHKAQKKIAKAKNKQYIGKRMQVLIEGLHPETEMLIVGRHHGQAPEIDGQVMINDTGNLALHEGKFVNVEITQVLDYDLVATVLPTQH